MSIDSKKLELLKDVLNYALHKIEPPIKVSDFPTLSDEQVTEIVVYMAKVSKSFECLEFLKLEADKWKSDRDRMHLMSRLIAVVEREIEILNFYPKDAVLQTEYPMPKEIKVTGSDSTISTEDFIKRLQGISNSSIFEE